jgi:hypothetical protein
VEGITNTTYWQDPGSAFVGGRNVAFMRMAGDTNPVTGRPAIRVVTPEPWRSIEQTATGLRGGRPYTFSGWFKGSNSGMIADVRVEFLDANGTPLGGGQAVYEGGNWRRVTWTGAAPAGTAQARVYLFHWTSGANAYMLYSDLQLEEGTSATAYSETMGVYYPDYPR